MDRRAFTKSCLMCAGGVAVSPFLTGCQSTYYTQGSIEPNGLSVLRSEFSYLKKGQPVRRDYIILRNERLEYPIYIYRLSDQEFSAVLMKCSHQGAALSAAGDHLHCPSHGSEFSNRGVVEQGPAEDNLRTFNVSADNEKIFIDLRS